MHHVLAHLFGHDFDEERLGGSIGELRINAADVCPEADPMRFSRQDSTACWESLVLISV